jgi:hypothetical protein
MQTGRKKGGHLSHDGLLLPTVLTKSRSCVSSFVFDFPPRWPICPHPHTFPLFLSILVLALILPSPSPAHFLDSLHVHLLSLPSAAAFPSFLSLMTTGLPPSCPLFRW